MSRTCCSAQAFSIVANAVGKSIVLGLERMMQRKRVITSGFFFVEEESNHVIRADMLHLRSGSFHGIVRAVRDISWRVCLEKSPSSRELRTSLYLHPSRLERLWLVVTKTAKSRDRKRLEANDRYRGQTALQRSEDGIFPPCSRPRFQTEGPRLVILVQPSIALAQSKSGLSS